MKSLRARLMGTLALIIVVTQGTSIFWVCVITSYSIHYTKLYDYRLESP